MTVVTVVTVVTVMTVVKKNLFVLHQNSFLPFKTNFVMNIFVKKIIYDEKKCDEIGSDE